MRNFQISTSSPRFDRVNIQMVRDETKIMSIFHKYDKNKSEQLEPDQLRSFLTDQASEAGVTPTDEDVAFILRSCDKDKSGTIKRNEVPQPSAP